MNLVKLRFAKGKYYPENELAAYLCEFADGGAYKRGLRWITVTQVGLLEQIGFRVEITK